MRNRHFLRSASRWLGSGQALAKVLISVASSFVGELTRVLTEAGKKRL
jgi:hypothetical protein